MTKTKKFLALILTIIMIVSTIPMAFAYSYDYDAYAEAFIDFMIYTRNIYISDEYPSGELSTPAAINSVITNEYLAAFDRVAKAYPELAGTSYHPELLREFPEAASALTDALNEVRDAVKKDIADGKYKLVIDTRAVYYPYCLIVFTRNSEMSNLSNKIPLEIIDDFKESTLAFDCFYRLVVQDPTSYSQADFDTAGADIIAFYTQLGNCLDGIHDNTYSNNNNDTHTVTCTFCTETSTVSHDYTDDVCICGATKVPVADDDTNTDTENKTEPEDKTDTDDTTEEEPAPMNFFQKIIEFFKNLFAKLFGWMKK